MFNQLVVKSVNCEQLYNKFKLCSHLAKQVYYTDKKVLVVRKKKELIIAIRGTSSCIDWFNNISIIRQHNDIHRGFYRYSLNCIEKHELPTLIKNNKQPITICAHSLGAVAATILIYQLAQYFKNIDCTLIMFGSPRPGGKEFAESFAEKLPNLKIYNIRNKKDVVWFLPLNIFGYTHIDCTEFTFDTDFKHYNIYKNHSINTYIDRMNNNF
jgi:predicted lipase